MTGRRAPVIPAPLLALYMALDAALLVYTRTAGAGLNDGHSSLAGQVLVLAAEAVLAVLAWRGRWWAWAVLVVLGALLLAVTAAAAISWSWYEAGVVALVAAQLAVLLAPACNSLARKRRAER